MKEYILYKPKSFILKHIFECGQCFRWNKQEDNSYTGIFGRNIINVKENENDILFRGVCDGDIEKICIDYFDLNRDYEEIKTKLSEMDNDLKKSIEFGNGIRLLNQNLWETIISFIISANNNIPRIKKTIERICQRYGEKIQFEGNNYYTFPTAENLSTATVKDLRELGLGFRDKRIYDTTNIILKQEVNLEKIKLLDSSDEIKEELIKLPGVGEKVADCVMLFSELKRLDVFPIDVWVRRVMNELYIKNADETKVRKEDIQKIAREKYCNLAGIAQQYLFYWKRENAEPSVAKGTISLKKEVTKKHK